MKLKKYPLNIIIFILLLVVFSNQKICGSGGRFPTWGLSFKGEASGGILVLAKTGNRYVKHVSIETKTGESVESIAQRLADTINAHHSRQTRRVEYDPHWLWVGGFQAHASEDVLILPFGPESYIIGGTETGLGIPKPPRFLSCSYHKEKDELLLNWENTSSEYDFILINGYWTDFDNRFGRKINGNSNSFIIDRERIPLNIDDMDFWVVGFRDNIPSNATAIHVSDNGYCQEETFGIPFNEGIAPNWVSWSTVKEQSKISFEEREIESYARFGTLSKTLLTKPFYQVIKAVPKGTVHGIYRKFLGLIPGHTYRLTACMNTLNMDSVKGNWSFSIHAVPTGKDKKDLTGKQMAGLASLPNSKSGPEAAQIAAFGPDRTTKREFDFAITGYTKLKDGTNSSNITLPSDANEITVWVRFSCDDPKGKVGFSGVKLEDLTAIKNPKSPEQIIQEENKQEAELQSWIERKSLQKQPDEK